MKELTSIYYQLLALALVALLLWGLITIFKLKSGKKIFRATLLLHLFLGVILPILLIALFVIKGSAGLEIIGIAIYLGVVFPICLWLLLSIYAISAYYLQIRYNSITPLQKKGYIICIKIMQVIIIVCAFTALIIFLFIQPKAEKQDEQNLKEVKKEWILKQEKRKKRQLERPAKRSKEMHLQTLKNKGDTIIDATTFKDTIENKELIEDKNQWFLNSEHFTGVAIAKDLEGNISARYQFFRGLEHGEQIIYGNEKRINDRRQFHLGNLLLREHWYSNGKKQFIRTYSIPLKEHGTWEEWYPNGQFKSQTLYNKGQIISSKSWHEGGSLKKKDS